VLQSRSVCATFISSLYDRRLDLVEPGPDAMNAKRRCIEGKRHNLVVSIREPLCWDMLGDATCKRSAFEKGYRQELRMEILNSVCN
jgi:hypothetical protein